MTALTFTIPAELWLSANQRLHWAPKSEVPCERCEFVPTPEGKCICRGGDA